MASGQTPIVPERSGAGAHMCQHRHPQQSYLTLQVLVQTGDGPYASPALDLGCAWMEIVIRTFRYPFTRTWTLPFFDSLKVHSLAEVRAVPSLQVLVTTTTFALLDFFA
jgi:hypothetical protein